MNKIYLVYGECGQYSDYFKWNVAAYEDEKLAKEHVDYANEWFKDNRKRNKSKTKPVYNPFDPSRSISFRYDTPSWGYDEVEFRTSLPAQDYLSETFDV
jgi:hypothetical protein